MWRVLLEDAGFRQHDGFVSFVTLTSPLVTLAKAKVLWRWWRVLPGDAGFRQHDGVGGRMTTSLRTSPCFLSHRHPGPLYRHPGESQGLMVVAATLANESFLRLTAHGPPNSRPPAAQRLRGAPGMLEMVIGHSRLSDQGGQDLVGERFGKALLLKGLKTPSVTFQKGLKTPSGGGLISALEKPHTPMIPVQRPLTTPVSAGMNYEAGDDEIENPASCQNYTTFSGLDDSCRTILCSI